MEIAAPMPDALSSVAGCPELPAVVYVRPLYSSLRSGSDSSTSELEDPVPPIAPGLMMRQIAGAFHQYEQARLVAKLQAARQRKRSSARSRVASHGLRLIPSW